MGTHQFTEATLTKATFDSESRLHNTTFSRAKLTKAVLDGVQMKNVKLERANLEDATMRNGSIEDADLSYAECKGFNLDGTKLTRLTLVDTKDFVP